MSSTTESESENTSGPKVLRIGIVQRGKIIEERELKKRETVTIGTHEKAMFEVNSTALPGVFNLFDYDGKDYFLRFTDGMDGRVQVDGENVADFQSCRTQGRLSKRGDAYALPITDDSRGKVMIGDVTVLFQFKSLAPAVTKPILPSDIRGSILENIDAQFAGILVAVAIVQISVVAYARSLPYAEPTTIEQIGQEYQRLIMPDRLPEPPLREEVAETKGKEEDKGKKEEEAKAKTPEKKAGPKKEVSAEDAARARKAAVTKQVAGKGLLRILGANRGGGADALNDVFGEGGAVGELGSAFSGIQGIDIAQEGGAAGTRGGGSGQGVGIGDLATEGGGSVVAGEKSEAAVRGDLKAGDNVEVDGQLSEEMIKGVMQRQLKAVRACYEGALKRDRKLAGKLVIRFEILESGKTSSIELDDVSLGSPEVKDCILRRAQFWRFPKPEGGSVFVAYPIVFSPAA